MFSWVCVMWTNKEGRGEREKWRETWLPNLLACRPSWVMGRQWLPNEPLLPWRAHPTSPPGVPNIRMKDCTHSITITCVAFPTRSGGADENTIFICKTVTCSPVRALSVLSHTTVETATLIRHEHLEYTSVGFGFSFFHSPVCPPWPHQDSGHETYPGDLISQ